MKKRSSILCLFFSFFNDTFNMGLVIVIFAPMLIGSEAIFLKNSSLATQTLTLGILLGSFPFAQFLTAPFFGALSDALGRRKTLLLAIAGCTFFNALAAISIYVSSLSLLFIARLLSGATAGNAPLAQAGIADLSSVENKTKNLSYIGMIGSASWVLGAPIGGIISNPNIVSWFNFSVPFWFATLLFFINLIWLYISFQETYTPDPSEKTNIRTELKNLSKVFHIPHMAVPIISLFLFYFGWMSFIYFFPATFVHRFEFTQTELGYFTAYLALCFFIASLHVKRLAHKYSPEKMIYVSLFISGLSLFVSSFIPIFWPLIITFLFACYFCAFVWVPYLALISNIGGTQNQGKVFGVQQALLSLATLVGPIAAGAVSTIDINFPTAMSGLLLLFALVIFFFFFYISYRKKKAQS